MALCNLAPMAPGEGNTKTPPKSPTRRCNAAKRWCWTLHNYTQEEMALLAPKLEGLGKFIWGEEICPETGTPHLQGYMEFDKKCRPLEKVKVMRNGNNVMSWRAAKKPRLNNINYCTKDNTNIRGNLKYDKPLKIIENLYQWQQDVVNIVKEEADDRTIRWYYDEIGNKGKSALVKYLVVNHGGLLVSGKGSDVKYMVKTFKESQGYSPSLILYDIPRECQQYISYQAIEEVKNGCFASTKYECEMIVMNSPHIICFSNFYPDSDKMSEDRWVITELN